MPNPIVTLVHGTFEPQASWTLEGSPLRRELAARTNAEIFMRFGWSGKNTFRDRHEAVLRFEEHVANAERSHPDARHFVVGHSHGGSIVAYWLKRSAENPKRLAGAAFLSTPFVAVRPIKSMRVSAALLSWPAVVISGMTALGLPAWVLLWLLHAAFGVGDSRAGDVFVIAAALFGSTVALAWYLWHRREIERYASGKATAELAAVAAGHSTCDLPHGRYLFLKTTADEVISALGAVQLVIFVTEKVQGGANRLFQVVRATANRFSALFGLLCLALLITWAIELPTGFAKLWRDSTTFGQFANGIPAIAYGHWWSWIFLGITYSLLFASTLVVAVWLAALAVMRVTLMAFGSIPAVQAAFLDVSVEPLPYGQWTLHHVEWDPGQAGLHHSAGYSAPGAIDLVSTWMCGEIGDDQASHRRLNFGDSTG